LRGTLRNFGLKVGVVGGSRYEARVRELVEGFPRLAAIVEPLLSVRRVMRQQFAVLHKMLLDMVRGDLVCRLLMTAPGVGAVVALTYRATVDQPQRFVHSRAVGAHVGLTPKRKPVRNKRLSDRCETPASAARMSVRQLAPGCAVTFSASFWILGLPADCAASSAENWLCPPGRIRKTTCRRAIARATFRPRSQVVANLPFAQITNKRLARTHTLITVGGEPGMRQELARGSLERQMTL
jgi:hypothetical protein